MNCTIFCSRLNVCNVILLKVWSLQSHKLRGLKPTSVLQDLDVVRHDNLQDSTRNLVKMRPSNFLQDADDVLHRMLEDIGSSSKNLHGHGGPVYGLSFSPGDLPVAMMGVAIAICHDGCRNRKC